jgi:hypothetical protein
VLANLILEEITHGRTGGAIFRADDDSCAIGDLHKFVVDEGFPLAEYGDAGRNLPMGRNRAREDPLCELTRDRSEMGADVFPRGFIAIVLHYHLDDASPCSQLKMMIDLILVESHGQIAALLDLPAMLFM